MTKFQTFINESNHLRKCRRWIQFQWDVLFTCCKTLVIQEKGGVACYRKTFSKAATGLWVPMALAVLMWWAWCYFWFVIHTVCCHRAHCDGECFHFIWLFSLPLTLHQHDKFEAATCTWGWWALGEAAVVEFYNPNPYDCSPSSSNISKRTGCLCH